MSFFFSLYSRLLADFPSHFGKWVRLIKGAGSFHIHCKTMKELCNVYTGRPRNPGATKLDTKLSYPYTLMKKYLLCHDAAPLSAFLAKILPFLSLFCHFFGCHGHKYAYFRNRSHMHLLWTYTKLV